MPIKRITPGVSDTSLVTTTPREYKDVDLNFTAKRGTLFDDGSRKGDVYKKTDTNSVIQSIENILLTNHYDKPFQPLFGADLIRLLFELNTTISEPKIEQIVRKEIERHEPRVQVVTVEVYDTGAEAMVPKGIENVFFYSSSPGAKDHSLIIYVTVRIKNTGEEVRVPVNMNRIR